MSAHHHAGAVEVDTGYAVNETSFRAELRAGLAVLRGDAFVVVDLGTSSGS